MIRWSVTWRLADHAIPAELERLRLIFADDPDYVKDPDHYLDVLSREKSRSFDRRPQADEKINQLITDPDITYIRLNRIDPWQHVMAWDAGWDSPPHEMAKGRYSSAYRKRIKITQAGIRAAQASGDRAVARMEAEQRHIQEIIRTTAGVKAFECIPTADPSGGTGIISGCTREGRRFHQRHIFFVQVDPAGRWHGYESSPLLIQSSFADEAHALSWLLRQPVPATFTASTDIPMKFATDEQEHMPTTTLTPASDFSFRSYQREDIARAAMHDGAIIAWDPGMGKTMALFAFFMLKRARRVLIVAPAALHEQIIGAGAKFFGVTVRPLADQEAALTYMREGILPRPGQDESDTPLPAKPDYFITAYNWLGYNGGDEWAADEEETNDLIRRRRYVVAARFLGVSAPDMNSKKSDGPAKQLGLKGKPTRSTIDQAWERAVRLNDPKLHPGDEEIARRNAFINDAYRKLTGMEGTEHDAAFSAKLQEIRQSATQFDTARRLREIEEGIGLSIRPGRNSPEGMDPGDQPIRCVFKPTLCSLVKHLFDGVVCDEAVRLKSGTAYQADGVLRMEARYRLALTGTPIKNKLPDLFFLASFVTGSKAKPTARWPYGNRTADRAQFAQDFGVWEENMTKQEKARREGKSSIPRGKTDPTRICNLHRLWRVISTVLIRRRKDDIPGTDIVPKTVVPVRVMPGTEQQSVYRFQLLNPPPHRSDLAELGHQLQCLRQATLYPASRSLFRPGQPAAQSSQRFTPKSAGIMQLAIDLMTTGEQLVIFSPFQDFAADLSDRFTSARIPHLNLDGKTDPLKRGALITRFKSGEFPILIGGIESMGEGHDLDCCSNLVLPSLAWAYDKNAQAVERVHRLTSKKPVTIYVMVTRNTIDERLVTSFQEKTDSNDLALDGRLVETDKEEIDLGQLLRDAVKDFNSDAPTLDESEVEEQWALSLMPGLKKAFESFRHLRPLPEAAPTPAREAPRRKPRPLLDLPRTATTTTTTTPPAKPVRLFDLMKNLRRHTDPAAINPPAPPPAPEPAPEPAPAPEPVVIQSPVVEIGKIIPFPGRLAKALAGQQKKPVVIPACLR